MKKLMIMYKAMHSKASIDRLYVKWKERKIFALRIVLLVLLTQCRINKDSYNLKNLSRIIKMMSPEN